MCRKYHTTWKNMKEILLESSLIDLYIGHDQIQF
jgi:hypothetical protein